MDGKWWLPNCRYVFAYNFYKQHLLHIKFHRRNEKNRGFHLIPKTPFQWMNPKVIGLYTFKSYVSCVGTLSLVHNRTHVFLIVRFLASFQFFGIAYVFISS